MEHAANGVIQPHPMRTEFSDGQRDRKPPVVEVSECRDDETTLRQTRGPNVVCELVLAGL